MSDAVQRLKSVLRTYGDMVPEAVAEAARAVAAALSRTRAEALEEAANALEADARAARERHERVGPSYIEADAKRIRSLIATPAPASIPVKRVREVLRTGEQRCCAEEGKVEFRLAANALGVPLDAAQTTPDPRDARLADVLDGMQRASARNAAGEDVQEAMRCGLRPGCVHDAGHGGACGNADGNTP